MPVLYLVACGAPPTAELPTVIPILQNAGWTVCVIATQAALEFVDRAQLKELTGLPVRCEPRRPGEADPFPPASAVAVAPLTFNTLNKWGAGISDTLPLGILNELMGAGLPIVASVWAKEALRRHPAFAGHVDLLRSAGVHFLGHGSGPDRLDWSALMIALARYL